MDLIPPAQAEGKKGESQNVDVCEVVAGLGFSSGEANFYAALIRERCGSGSNVAVVLGCPCLAHLVEKSAAGVVVVRILSEDEDGECFFRSLVVDRCEVELNAGDGLTDQVFGGHFFTTCHQVRQGQGFCCNFSEVRHCNSPAVRDASLLNFFEDRVLIETVEFDSTAWNESSIKEYNLL